MIKRSERAKPTAGKTRATPTAGKRKSIANSRQKENNKTCAKSKAKHGESMKHTQDPHIQHKVNEELTKNTLKTRRGSFRTEKVSWHNHHRYHGRSLQE